MRSGRGSECKGVARGTRRRGVCVGSGLRLQVRSFFRISYNNSIFGGEGLLTAFS